METGENPVFRWLFRLCLALFILTYPRRTFFFPWISRQGMEEKNCSRLWRLSVSKKDYLQVRKVEGKNSLKYPSFCVIRGF